MDINLNFNCKNVLVSKDGDEINLDIKNADMDQVLNQITLKQIIKAYGTGELLDQIGIHECKVYFDLVEDSEK